MGKQLTDTDRYTARICWNLNTWRFPSGDAPRTISRKGIPGVTYDPLHPRLQANLLKLLQNRYGKRHAIRESDNVDIRVSDGQKTILIEIKTDPNPRAAIRAAIGQLLEYAYYKPQPRTDVVELLIVAPRKIDKARQRGFRRCDLDQRAISYVNEP